MKINKISQDIGTYHISNTIQSFSYNNKLKKYHSVFFYNNKLKSVQKYLLVKTCII